MNIITSYPKNNNEIIDRVSRLRALMKEHEIQAYLIPSADPHNNEYVPAGWKRREFISGFTGSAGDVVITLDEGGLWTDGRYFIQGEEQLQGSGIDLYKKEEPGVPEMPDWIAEKVAGGGALGVDPRVLTSKTAALLEKALTARGGSLRYLESNLVDEIWDDQPGRAHPPIEILPLQIAGQSIGDKLEAVREKLAQKCCCAHLISTLDAIAWLYNLRGSDIPHNRVFIAYAAVTSDAAYLFIEPERMAKAVEEHLQGLVTVRPYEDIAAFTRNLDVGQERIWIDPGTTSQWLVQQIGEGVPVFEERSPIADLKAVKNSVELEGFRSCHITDGIAMVRFLKWLEEVVPEGGVTEMSASRKLAEFRSEGEGFIGESFSTIAGYAGHGAIIHYESCPETDVELKAGGILLLDSGGHYHNGTTDITRTVTLGKPTPEERDVFTRVLKGLIAMTIIKFPQGSTGKHIEMVARKALWDSGRNFKHGTGHGVGHSLSVHEGPVYLSPRAPEVPLHPGQVLSNEPGFYKEGEFGVRLENLMIARRDEALSSSGGGDFLTFEPITFCPIDRHLITKELLDEEEVEWLNEYHREVYENLAPGLDENHRGWLQTKTASL